MEGIIGMKKILMIITTVNVYAVKMYGIMMKDTMNIGVAVPGDTGILENMMKRIMIKEDTMKMRKGEKVMKAARDAQDDIVVEDLGG